MTYEYMRGNGTGEATTEVFYTYDELHQVVKAKENYGNKTRTYQYDSLGNLTWEQNSNNVTVDYKLNNLNQITSKSEDGWKTATTMTYDNRGNLVKEAYGKNKKVETVGAYTYDETNKMVKGVNASAESSSYLYNGLDALVQQTWVIAKNGYGYHDVDADVATVDVPVAAAAKGGNGKGNSDKPTGSDVKKTSTVVKDFVVDYTVDTMDPLMEYETNGLTYRYVYGNERLSVNITGIENGAGKLIENGNQVRLYYHQDLRGTVDYLTSPMSQKVESWTHYNEWGEITHNAVVKCGQRELDLVKNYTGHEYDAVLDQYYAKARMYDAANRRFTSVDPILDAARYDMTQYVENPRELVQYLYVMNGPLSFIDLLGEYLIQQVEKNDGSIFYRLVEENAPAAAAGKAVADYVPFAGKTIVRMQQGGDKYVGGTGQIEQPTGDFTKENLDGLKTALQVIERSAVIAHKSFNGEGPNSVLKGTLIILGLKDTGELMTFEDGAKDVLKKKIGDANFNVLTSIMSTKEIMESIVSWESFSSRISLDRKAFQYLETYQNEKGGNILESENMGELVALMTVIEEYIARDYDYHYSYSYRFTCHGESKRRDDEWVWYGPTNYTMGYYNANMAGDAYAAYVEEQLRLYDIHKKTKNPDEKQPPIATDPGRTGLEARWDSVSVSEQYTKRKDDIFQLIDAVLEEYK